MITMYAAVANRTAEIGALRALGFQRYAILVAFLAESLLLALVGGVIGLVLASFMQFFSISTMNWQSFAELAFSFSLNPRIVLVSVLFSLIMGLIGGFLPALRAARMKHRRLAARRLAPVIPSKEGIQCASRNHLLDSAAAGPKTSKSECITRLARLVVSACSSCPIGIPGRPAALRSPRWTGSAPAPAN